MKKQYIKPSIKAVKIRTCQILSGSSNGVSNNVQMKYGGRSGGAIPMSKDDDYDDTFF